VTDEQALEKLKSQQRTINTFHRVFGTEDGKAVLAHLHTYFRTDRPIFERAVGNRFDTIAAAIRDGQREVMLYIHHKLATPTKGDADIETPTTKVLR